MLPSVEGFGGFTPKFGPPSDEKGGVATLRCASYRACAGCMREWEVQLPSGPRA